MGRYQTHEWVTCLDCGQDFRRDIGQGWRVHCVDCWKWREANGPPLHALGLDAEMVRRLLYLCHPDKHKGSEASHTATQWLLTLRERVEREAQE